MNQFRRALKEINFVLGNVSVFEVLLNAIIIFLACYLLLMVFKFYPILSAIPAIAYFAFSIGIRMNKMRKSKAKIVEESHPPLKEKLRTAIDNIKVSNPIVEALQEEVVSDMKNVRISSFISGRLTSYKILACVILCFIILFVSAKDFSIELKQLADRGRGIIDASYIIGGDELGEEMGEILAATGGTDLDDIYGEESMANLGSEIIDVEIRPISYEINVRDVKDVEEKEFEETILDETCADVGACAPQESFRNEYPKEQQELVKNYFLKIAK